MTGNDEMNSSYEGDEDKEDVEILRPCSYVRTVAVKCV